MNPEIEKIKADIVALQALVKEVPNLHKFVAYDFHNHDGINTPQIDAANVLNLDTSGSWPVGSVFISVVSTNPATLLGFGTWTAFATGRTIVGIDAGQTEFDVVEETGGEKTHTLTTAELASHAHGVTNLHGNGGVVAPLFQGASTSSSFGTMNDTDFAGSGNAHNNLQPYIVVYMWKRTA